jgi:formylglycine-generating enzyme required for sulfatase activity
MQCIKINNAMLRGSTLIIALLLVVLDATPRVMAQTAAVSTAEISAARAKSELLSPDQRDQAQDHFKDAFDLYQAGQFEPARWAFLSGLAIDPANAAAHFYMGETLSRLGDREAAVASYSKAMALDPNSDIARQAAAAIKNPAPPAAIVAGAGRKPKDSFKDCEQCPEMIVIPAGSFIMGSEQGEPGHYDNEVPKRTVSFVNQFAVGKFAVTFDEWDACKADGGCNGYSPPDNSWGRGRQPVIFVSWIEAKSYVAWLSRKTGKTYRLLSESEREYVARAGTKTTFWWGDQVSPSLANYDGNYSFNNAPKGEFRGRPLPVDSFVANPWGLYQVHGNVLEWLEDCADDVTWKNYANAPSDGSPQKASDCKARMLRGGAWDDLPRSLRSATRANASQGQKNYAYGFRVARDLER